MRAILVVLLVTTVVGGLGLVAVLGAAIAGGVACPLALLEGELVAVASTPHADAASQPDALGVRGAGGGDTVRVTWPFGYRVERQDGALVLVHLLTPVGREGDWVSVGGGSADDGSFVACGPVSVGTPPSGATEDPPAETPTANPTAAAATPGTETASVRFGHVPDAEVLHGDGVGRSSVVRLPDGSFLLFRREDVAGGAWSVLGGEVPGTAGTRIDAIAANEAGVVAVGSRPGTDASRSITAWWSPDGRSWDPDDAVPVRGGLPWDIAAGQDRLLLIGRTPRTLLIGDARGRTWARARLPGPDGEVMAVTPTGAGFVAVGAAGDDGIAWISRDARRWQRLPPVLPGARFRSVAAAGDRVVASATATTSTDEDGPERVILVESLDGGRTWGPAGIPLDGADEAAVVAVPGGVLVTTAGPAGIVHWLALGPDPWVPAVLEPTGLDERAHVMSAAGTPDRTVILGATLGTGAGGDRVVLWTGAIP